MKNIETQEEELDLAKKEIENIEPENLIIQQKIDEKALRVIFKDDFGEVKNVDSSEKFTKMYIKHLNWTIDKIS